jgi:hypothetical protein
LDHFEAAEAAITDGIARVLTAVKTLLAPELHLMTARRLPVGIAVTRRGTKMPVKIAWTDENGFEVPIKLVRNHVRPRKPSKRGSSYGTAGLWTGD